MSYLFRNSRRSLGLSLFRPSISALCGKRGRSTSLQSELLHRTESIHAGDSISGYTVQKVTPLPDFTAVGVSLTHDKTGAEHFHLARDDQNNVFSVGFRTTPMDSTGVPHILEHTVLCGSRMFPCRDPFFKMLNRSLATFMNAFTASDFTMYPFSTQNGKDFKNLLSVYLDAVFFPNLRQLDFWQEGWRLENEVTMEMSSPIIFKGVVFNEMKGALSSGEAIFATRNQNLLLPSHTYGNVSGGDPLVIPELTWSQLKDFHSSHYHPSNAKFFTYGDLPLETHLQFIDEFALKQFDKQDLDTNIPPEKPWTEPRSATITCPVDAMAADPEKQTTVAVSYMLGDLHDPFEAFTVGILSTLLVSGPNSPFYQALIDSNIGSGYSPVIGLDGHTKDASFSVGLQGIKPTDVEGVVDTINETFKKAMSDGFDKERIDSILHTVELAQKHQTSNFGLGFISNAMSGWNHGEDPSEMLQINKLVSRFNDEMSMNSRYLKEKIDQYFIRNNHRLTLVMNPDDDYQTKQTNQEEKLLHEKLSQLTEDDRKDIFTKGLKLAELQNTEEDISCLPRMQVEDVDQSVKRTTTSTILLGNDVPLQLCEQPTNGITYFRAVARTTTLPYILQPYLPLFCHVLTKMGAGSMSYKELSQQAQLFTGGLSSGPHLAAHFDKDDTFEQGVSFSSHCLDKNIPHMFYLWQEVFGGPLFNNKDRLKTLLNSYAADLAMSIPDSGHAYAMAAASSSLTALGGMSEMLGGLTQVRFVKNLVEGDDIDDVAGKLIQIAAHVLSSTEMRCSLNALPQSVEPASEALEQLVNMISSSGPDEENHTERPAFTPKGKKTHICLPFPVNYVSRCSRAVTYTHPDHPKLQILTKLLTAKYLHREIREKGGAYGGGARLGNGVVQFFSYRDPNSVKTLEAFDESVDWAAAGTFTDQDIEEAKLSVFAAIDSPVSPAQKGSGLFYSGITDDMRQVYRDSLFGVTRNDLIDVTSRYLAKDAQVNAFAIIGADNKDIAKDDLWVTKKEDAS